VVGFAGWLIGLAVVCVATGELSVLGQVALPGLAVSLGAAGLVIVTFGLAAASPGRERVLRPLLVGQALFFVGILILLVNHWIAPLVDAAPELRLAIERLGGVYRTGDWLPTALMAAGTVLLGRALAQLRRPV
jgi:hypothetical protein